MWIVARIDVCRRRARSRAGEVRAAWDMVWGRGLSCKNSNPCGPARVRQAGRAQVGEAAAFELPAATRLDVARVHSKTTKIVTKLVTNTKVSNLLLS